MTTIALNPASRVFKTRKGAANAAARLNTPDLNTPYRGTRVVFEVGTALYPVRGFVVLARTESVEA